MGITRRGVAGAAAALSGAAQAHGRPAPKPILTSAWPDATEIAARIRRGELTAREAVAAAIDRAEALQPKLHFLVNSDFDRALDKAAQPGAGPFAGVPFLIKDLDDYAGLPTRMGSASALRAQPARTQAPLMNAYDHVGLITLGKSATPEFGLSATTEPRASGPTRNPWDLARSAGGSSGGAAAAVAAGVVPVAHASDGGGSIRIPASCCGLFGLKPSRGRMIGARGETHVTDLGVQHCLSRSVRDSAALFALTEDAAEGARFPPVGLVTGPGQRRLRIGLVQETAFGGAPDADVARAVARAASLVESLGHRLEPTGWPIDGDQVRDDFLLLWAQGAREAADAVTRAVGRPADERDLELFTLGLAEMARRAEPGALPAAIARLEGAAMAYDTWFASQQLDVVLSGVTASAAPPIGFLAPDVPFETLVERMAAYAAFTPLHNVAGAPAMSVPLAWTADGLPAGVMFAARAGGERTLFELAYELETARPWAWRTPPLVR